MKAPLFQSVAALLAFVGPVLAQAKDPWIGRRVFTQDGTVLKAGDKILDDEGRSRSLATSGKGRRSARIYVVQHVNGEWLWLKDEESTAAGWVQSKRVIPYEQAIDHYTNLIRSNPSASLHNQRGFFWLQKGEYDIAIADLNEAIRAEPGNANFYNNRGAARYDKKEYDRAIADFDEAIRIDPKYAWAYYNRGNVRRNNKKEYDRAVADYDEAIRLDPKFAWAYGNRAWLWATCPDAKYRDGKRAVESATKACELTGWKDANQLDILAAAYAEAGDFDRAVEWQEKAQNLISDEEKKQWGKRLDLYREKKPYRDAD